MPRSIWNGTVALGLLSVPVKLHTATESKTVHFHEVHVTDGSRIEHRRVCTKEDREVPFKEVVKGYEVAPDEYVVLDDDEVKAAAGSRGKRVEIEDVVPAPDIDPVFYDKTYYAGAGEGGAEAYRLLHDALAAGGGRAAIGRWTFHDRERLVAIRPRDGLLVLHTLRFADELVAGKDVEVRAPQRKPDKKEVAMAAQLVDTLHEDFDASQYEDEYRKAVLEVVERKARGEDVAPPPDEEPEQHDDLMAALQASLAGAKKAGAR